MGNLCSNPICGFALLGNICSSRRAVQQGAHVDVHHKKEIIVTVVQLSGETILHKMEMRANNRVDILKRKVRDVLGCTEIIQLVVDGRNLSTCSSIEESGLADDSTITAVFIPRVPTLLRKRKRNKEQTKPFVKYFVR